MRGGAEVGLPHEKIVAVDVAVFVRVAVSGQRSRCGAIAGFLDGKILVVDVAIGIEIAGD